MREIKFRAWDKVNKEMVDRRMFAISNDGKILRQTFSDQFLYPGPTPEGFCEFKRDQGKIIIMQYTGLKDKKGKEIYEGDIILATIIENLLPSGENSEYVDKRVVEWNKEQGGFAFAEDEYEIIGNIYENKDLLNVVN